MKKILFILLLFTTGLYSQEIVPGWLGVEAPSGFSSSKIEVECYSCKEDKRVDCNGCGIKGGLFTGLVLSSGDFKDIPLYHPIKIHSKGNLITLEDAFGTYKEIPLSKLKGYSRVTDFFAYLKTCFCDNALQDYYVSDFSIDNGTGEICLTISDNNGGAEITTMCQTLPADDITTITDVINAFDLTFNLTQTDPETFVFEFTDEDGVVQTETLTIPEETVTTMSQSPNGDWNYTNEDGATYTFGYHLVSVNDTTFQLFSNGVMTDEITIGASTICESCGSITNIEVDATDNSVLNITYSDETTGNIDLCDLVQMTVNAGTTGTSTDNSNGEVVVDCDDILHFWASDGGINVSVVSGSAVVDLDINESMLVTNIINDNGAITLLENTLQDHDWYDAANMGNPPDDINDNIYRVNGVKIGDVGNPESGSLLDVDGDVYIGGGATMQDSDAEVLRVNAQSQRWYFGVLNDSDPNVSDVFISKSGDGGDAGLKIEGFGNNLGLNKIEVDNGVSVHIGMDNVTGNDPLAIDGLNSNGNITTASELLSIEYVTDENGNPTLLPVIRKITIADILSNVPAGSDDQLIDTDGTPGNVQIENGNTITVNVNDNDSDPTNELQDWTNLPNIPTDFSDNVDNVDDADNNPTNEIELPTGGTNGQILETDGSGNYTWRNDNHLGILDQTLTSNRNILMNDYEYLRFLNEDDNDYNFDFVTSSSGDIDLSGINGIFSDEYSHSLFFNNPNGFGAITLDEGSEAFQLWTDFSGGFEMNSIGGGSFRVSPARNNYHNNIGVYYWGLDAAGAPPATTTLNQAFVRDPSSGQVFLRDLSTLGGGGNSTIVDNGNGTSTITTDDSNSITVDNDGIDNVDDADNDPTNEIQNVFSSTGTVGVNPVGNDFDLYLLIDTIIHHSVNNSILLEKSQDTIYHTLNDDYVRETFFNDCINLTSDTLSGGDADFTYSESSGGGIKLPFDYDIMAVTLNAVSSTGVMDIDVRINGNTVHNISTGDQYVNNGLTIPGNAGDILTFVTNTPSGGTGVDIQFCLRYKL